MTNLQVHWGWQDGGTAEFIKRKQLNYDRYKKLFDGFALGTIIGFGWELLQINGFIH